MTKEVLIKLPLVEESCLKRNDEIADEIFKEITEGTAAIPWCSKVDLVSVVAK